jgi:hypothetical protein
VSQVLLGARSEHHWLRMCYARLGHLFPYLPHPAGRPGKDHLCQDSIRPRARPATSRMPGLPRYAFTSSAPPPRTFTDNPGNGGSSR